MPSTFPPARHWLASAAVAVASTVACPTAHASGGLVQKPGTAGCVTEPAAAGCAPGRALQFAQGAAVSPDGKNVYVASSAASGVAVFDRNPSTGALAQKPGPAGCVMQSPTNGCASGIALSGA